MELANHDRGGPDFEETHRETSAALPLCDEEKMLDGSRKVSKKKKKPRGKRRERRYLVAGNRKIENNTEEEEEFPRAESEASGPVLRQKE